MKFDAPQEFLPGQKKNSKKSKKSENNACRWLLFLIGYMYMIKKKTLKERIQEAKKRNYLTLLQIFDIILINNERTNTYE